MRAAGASEGCLDFFLSDFNTMVCFVNESWMILARLNEVQEELLYTPGVGFGDSKMLKVYIKVFLRFVSKPFG